jgi:UV DNA damage repair endonuclease
MRSEKDVLQERIEKDLVAIGEFTSKDLMSHSVNPDDFTLLEGGGQIS